MLARDGAVEAMRSRWQDVLGDPGARSVALRDLRECLDAALQLGTGQLLGRPRDVDGLPRPIGTRESKITMLTSGRAEMFRECVASGEETQWKLV